MVASKYLHDEGEDEEVFNDDWAKAGKKLIVFFLSTGETMYSRWFHLYMYVHISGPLEGQEHIRKQKCLCFVFRE